MDLSNVRLAITADYSSIAEWDEFWGDRRQEMQRGELYVYEESALAVGYLSLSRSLFMNYPFISFICVKKENRRHGVGTALLDKVAHTLEGGRHFTSTEPDNTAAANLFESAGFVFVGQLSKINLDGAENFYLKES